jgi:hypothetical protein
LTTDQIQWSGALCDEHQSLSEPALRLLAAVEADDDGEIAQAASDYLIEHAMERLYEWLADCAEVLDRWSAGDHSPQMPSRADYEIDA